MGAQKFEVGDVIRYGWETTKANLKLVIVLTVVGGLVTGIPTWIAEGVERSSPFLSAIFRLTGAIISLIVGVGALRVSLRLHDGQPVAVRDLFAVDRPLLWRYFLATVLYSLIVGVGFLLLVIPGIILAVRYAFYGYFVVERGARPFAALTQSAGATQGARWDVFLLGLVFILLNVLGAMLLLVGLLISIPVTTLAAVRAYRKLTGGASVAVPGMRQPSPLGAR